MCLSLPVTVPCRPMSDPDRPTILILGGTAEAAGLAQAVVVRWGARVRVITSLAGRTQAPAGVAGEVRTGGFGGVGPMATYLETMTVRAVIDATHPFAAQISRNAQQACDQVNTPRLVLDRPPWNPVEGDQWHMVPDMSAAAAELPRSGRRAFLTVGRTELAVFAGCSDTWFLARLIDPPSEPLSLRDYHVIVDRGPFSVAGETALLKRHEIDIVVCKASGGEMTYAKLAAARAIGCPVLMVARPPLPEGDRVSSIDGVVGWLSNLLT